MPDDLRSQLTAILGAQPPQQAAQQPAPQQQDLGATIASAVAQGLSAALGQGAPAPATPAQPAAAPAGNFADLLRQQMSTQGPPVTGAGSPAPPPKYTEDTKLWDLSQSDREHLVRQKGNHWYRATLRKQLVNTKMNLRG